MGSTKVLITFPLAKKAGPGWWAGRGSTPEDEKYSERHIPVAFR